MNMKGSSSVKLMGIGFLAFLMIGFLASCKGSKTEESRPVAEQEVYTLDVLKPVLGEAKDDISGILDVTGNAQELIISYRYYDVDLKNYDDDMVRELAPKIEALYKRFKALDRVAFHVITNNPLVPGVWKPFVDFALNRKTIEQLAWSGILTQDFFKLVIELKRFD
jgi:hypothetical protein